MQVNGSSLCLPHQVRPLSLLFLSFRLHPGGASSPAQLHSCDPESAAPPCSPALAKVLQLLGCRSRGREGWRFADVVGAERERRGAWLSLPAAKERGWRYHQLLLGEVASTELKAAPNTLLHILGSGRSWDKSAAGADRMEPVSCVTGNGAAWHMTAISHHRQLPALPTVLMGLYVSCSIFSHQK